jgi:hypothetical protein
VDAKVTTRRQLILDGKADPRDVRRLQRRSERRLVEASRFLRGPL